MKNKDYIIMFVFQYWAITCFSMSSQKFEAINSLPVTITNTITNHSFEISDLQERPTIKSKRLANNQNSSKRVDNVKISKAEESQLFVASGIIDHSKVVASVPLESTNSKVLDVVTQVMGWIYFLAWGVCFYPQFYKNWKRQSVVGYNFDFLTLNTVDLTLYSVYNFCLFTLHSIDDEYKKEYRTKVIPVKINDLIFSAHGVLSCIIMIIQCRLYERGGQKVSKACNCLVLGILLFIISVLVAALISAVTWLHFLTYLSYVKLITTLKYGPQAYSNYKRKSTTGFSIGFVVLDVTGGVFSIGQMVINSYQYNDWTSFSGNPTKVGVGLTSILFNIILALQHYLCYNTAIPREILVNATEKPKLNVNV